MAWLFQIVPSLKLLEEGLGHQSFGLEGNSRKPLDNFFEHERVRCSATGIKSYASLNMMAISLLFVGAGCRELGCSER